MLMFAALLNIGDHYGRHDIRSTLSIIRDIIFVSTCARVVIHSQNTEQNTSAVRSCDKPVGPFRLNVKYLMCRYNNYKMDSYSARFSQV